MTYLNGSDSTKASKSVDTFTITKQLNPNQQNCPDFRPRSDYIVRYKIIRISFKIKNGEAINPDYRVI